jgi:hypothetical protein
MSKSLLKRASRIKIKSEWIKKVGCTIVEPKGKILGFKLPLRENKFPTEAVILLDSQNYLIKSMEYLPKERMNEYRIELKK